MSLFFPRARLAVQLVHGVHRVLSPFRVSCVTNARCILIGSLTWFYQVLGEC